MASHTPVQDDPEQLEHAQQIWTNFTVGMQWTIRIIAVALVGLLIAFVPKG